MYEKSKPDFQITNGLFLFLFLQGYPPGYAPMGQPTGPITTQPGMSNILTFNSRCLSYSTERI